LFLFTLEHDQKAKVRKIETGCGMKIKGGKGKCKKRDEGKQKSGL
jgi:hypothetical protein